MKRSAEVLRSWFGEVQHFHDAPMLYNSAVRRTVLEELRKSKGRLFVGTSPDIASGAILMAKLGEYRLLDMPLVLSWYGDWSIGVSSGKGEQGAAAAYLAEFGRNPIRDAGLVTSVAGSVAETLLACKAQFPELFLEYHVQWSGYIRSARWELLKRERSGIRVDREVEFLYSIQGKAYNRFDVAVGFLRFRWECFALLKRVRARLARLLPTPADVDQSESHGNLFTACELPPILLKHVEAYFALPAPSSPSFRNLRLAPLSSDLTFEEAYLVASEIGERLDTLNLNESPRFHTRDSRQPVLDIRN